MVKESVRNMAVLYGHVAAALMRASYATRAVYSTATSPKTSSLAIRDRSNEFAWCIFCVTTCNACFFSCASTRCVLPMLKKKMTTGMTRNGRMDSQFCQSKIFSIFKPKSMANVTPPTNTKEETRLCRPIGSKGFIFRIYLTGR